MFHIVIPDSIRNPVSLYLAYHSVKSLTKPIPDIDPGKPADTAQKNRRKRKNTITPQYWNITPNRTPQKQEKINKLLRHRNPHLGPTHLKMGFNFRRNVAFETVYNAYSRPARIATTRIVSGGRKRNASTGVGLNQTLKSYHIFKDSNFLFSVSHNHTLSKKTKVLEATSQEANSMPYFQSTIFTR
jgi:hypothetical protein